MKNLPFLFPKSFPPATVHGRLRCEVATALFPPASQLPFGGDLLLRRGQVAGVEASAPLKFPWDPHGISGSSGDPFDGEITPNRDRKLGDLVKGHEEITILEHVT